MEQNGIGELFPTAGSAHGDTERQSRVRLSGIPDAVRSHCLNDDQEGSGTIYRPTLRSKIKDIKPSQMKRINVDTTVQEKTIRIPTDARTA